MYHEITENHQVRFEIARLDATERDTDALKGELLLRFGSSLSKYKAEKRPSDRLGDRYFVSFVVAGPVNTPEDEVERILDQLGLKLQGMIAQTENKK